MATLRVFVADNRRANSAKEALRKQYPEVQFSSLERTSLGVCFTASHPELLARDVRHLLGCLALRVEDG